MKIEKLADVRVDDIEDWRGVVAYFYGKDNSDYEYGGAVESMTRLPNYDIILLGYGESKAVSKEDGDRIFMELERWAS